MFGMFLVQITPNKARTGNHAWSTLARHANKTSHSAGPEYYIMSEYSPLRLAGSLKKGRKVTKGLEASPALKNWR
jgi:hypothetical protein